MSCIDMDKVDSYFSSMRLCPKENTKLGENGQLMCLYEQSCRKCYKSINKRFIDVVKSSENVDISIYYSKNWFIIN